MANVWQPNKGNQSLTPPSPYQKDRSKQPTEKGVHYIATLLLVSIGTLKVNATVHHALISASATIAGDSTRGRTVRQKLSTSYMAKAMSVFSL